MSELRWASGEGGEMSAEFYVVERPYNSQTPKERTAP
jgi:hypothetical protein